MGYPDQALAWSREAIVVAQELSRPFGEVYILSWVARVHQNRRDVQTVYEQTHIAMSSAAEYRFEQFHAAAQILHGWAQVMQGHSDKGIAQMRQGLENWRSTGAEVMLSYYLGLLADAYSCVGQSKMGLTVLGEALDMVQTHDERHYEAELYRLKGALRLSATPNEYEEAEACFHQALEVSRRQQAKSLELRAATSLARLWQSQGKRQEEYDLLVPVYNWFTEGFDTADLQDAKMLLDEFNQLSEGWGEIKAWFIVFTAIS